VPVLANEGGYSLSYVPYCGLGVLEELMGFRTSIVDPNLANRDNIPGQDLAVHQDEVINEIAQNLPQ
jgi:hypothetical protein